MNGMENTSVLNTTGPGQTMTGQQESTNGEAPLKTRINAMAVVVWVVGFLVLGLTIWVTVAAAIFFTKRAKA